MQQTRLEKWWGLAFAISILGIVVVTVSLADSKELPTTIIGAVLGVAMTVFATFFLFKGQSKQQLALLEEQHRIEHNQEYETEVFKQKLTTYNRFLDALCEYVKTKSEVSQAELKFRTAALAMHSDVEQMTLLNQTIAEIMNIFAEETTDDRRLVKALFSIADAFGKELYPKREMILTKEYEISVESLTTAIEDSALNTDITEIEAEDAANDTAGSDVISDASTWHDKINALKAAGWTAKVDTATDKISFTNPAANHSISIYKKGRFYVVQAQGSDGDTEFSKTLKAQYKGSRRANIWWRELTSLPNYGVSNGLSTAIASNDKARAVVVKWIDKLI
ncbi:MAG: hypothetical protein NC453_19060 [Muribaculum sp.]|nr:hypothetical protein [Muribaculum sp.]